MKIRLSNDVGNVDANYAYLRSMYDTHIARCSAIEKDN